MNTDSSLVQSSTQLLGDNPSPMEVHNSNKKDQVIETPKNRPGVENDVRFKNLSEGFIAFGNLMCDKLHEIVEPLCNSNDELQKLFQPIQKDMKTVLGDSKKRQELEETCEKVQVEQKSCNMKINQIEQENKDLKTRLTRLENKMLEKNPIFHGIKEDNWGMEDNAKEHIW